LNFINGAEHWLDWSGGSVFRIKPGAAKVELFRAARSTLTLRKFWNP